MSRQISIVCDQCGTIKGESNHWWSIGMSEGESADFVIRPGSITGTSADTSLDCCSEECAHRLLGKWMRGELGK